MNLFVFFMLCVSVVIGSNENLVSVVVIYRHGDRTPTHFSPNDMHKDNRYWSLEPGELTNRGKQQQFALGHSLRTRYNDFLPPTYHKDDIYVRSTSADRCLMSAAVNLAGLYPPQGDQTWSNSLHWMPIPIHSVPLEQDSVLRGARACHSMNSKFEELKKSDNFTKIDKENAVLYEFLTKNLGEEIKTFADIEDPYDTLTIEQEHNMKLPEWVNTRLRNQIPVYPDEMKKWADLSYELSTYTPEMARLGSGRFFETLASHLQAAAKNDTKNTLGDKMVMFSAHKSTIADFTRPLGVFKLAPFAGALVFELRVNPSTHKHYVNTIFSQPNWEHLKISGCDVDCDLDKFLELIQHLRITEDQWKAECLSGASGLFSSTTSFVSVLFGVVFYYLF